MSPGRPATITSVSGSKGSLESKRVKLSEHDHCEFHLRLAISNLPVGQFI